MNKIKLSYIYIKFILWVLYFALIIYLISQYISCVDNNNNCIKKVCSLQDF